MGATAQGVALHGSAEFLPPGSSLLALADAKRLCYTSLN